ncbi:MAG: class I SAM-dependent methyltransferase [Rubrobacter sp.]
MARDWDAARYEELSSPQTLWGAGVLERLEARGDEYALDAGCGTGRVTGLLLERLPDGRVLAMDGSGAMVEAARRRFAGEPRVRVECQDLLSLEVAEPVDLVFSTATFHWIKDHEVLFERLARALKPGGRLVAQCGGEGNISRATQAAEETMEEERFLHYFEGWDDDKNYAGVEATRSRLEAAGFEEVEIWLHDEPTRFGSAEELASFLATVVLGGHLERLPEGEREPFAAAVAERIAAFEEPPVLDYVRLNMNARTAA